MIVRTWDGNIKYLVTIRSSFPDPGRIQIRRKSIRNPMAERRTGERIKALKQEARELIRAIRGG
jgi:hypothetical protein